MKCNIQCQYCYQNPIRDADNVPRSYDLEAMKAAVEREGIGAPAVIVIGVFGEGKTTELLIASQVCLSMQLGFAVWPLMRFTGEKAKMGEFANHLWIKILGWTTAGIIVVLNMKLLLDTFLPDSVLKSLYNFLHLPAPMQ